MSTGTIPHGTLTGAKRHRCKCADCRQTYSEYMKEYRRRRARQRPTTDLVDAQPVREHLGALLDAGLTLGMICRAARVTMAWARYVREGCATRNQPPARRTSGVYARRVLALPVPGRVESSRRVSGEGACRRARALMAIGLTAVWQAEQLGAHPISYYRFVYQGGRVEARTAALVCDLYAQFWDKPGTGPAADRARDEAAVLGWSPPAGWEDQWLDLSAEELAAELAREVALMDYAELVRCYKARREQGERSPLVVAAAKEFNRQRTARNRQRKAAA
ncbi:hypothetical protein ACWFMI_24805 [Nocardiopsis terrae]|uniref:hypothetical protein n=1 Tax=Streptomyces sp. NPDC057554 TaxID=3350538 RepID=UPI0036919483